MRIVYEGNYIRMTCGEIALVDECLFYYFELILFVCVDALRRCQHFCSHANVSLST